MTDDERSKNSTPLTSHQGDLGDTSPAVRKAGDEAQSYFPPSPQLSPIDKKTAPLLPTQAQPLPAPVDVDSMALPVRDESVPYWERLAPLPVPGERPGTSSRRPQSSAGKITIYQTEKQKNLKAEDLEILLYCGVLQCIAVCVAACFIFFITFFKEFAPKDFEAEDLEMCCSVLQCVAACCSVLQCV